MVGAGGRSPMFLEPIFDAFKNSAELVGLCDPSPTRMEFQLKQIRKVAPEFSCPLYVPETFGKMLRDTRPDTVLVCSPDFTHHDYIIRSLQHGCDVVTEKPITIDAAKCRAILKAVRTTKGRLRVIFNYRWTAGVTKVKELIMKGEIGTVQQISMNYLLNTRHGADYFRRWHSRMEFSGGLLVHKATHHFDLVNWWLDSIPESVFATGRLAFYGKENALRRGDGKYTKYARYTGTKSEGDPFRLDLNKSENLRGLYLDAERDSGYLRDRNVFRDDIDIYDTMSALVQYRSGITLNYSLNAFSPDEGFHVQILGDRGRIDYHEMHAAHIISGQGNKALGKEQGEGMPDPELILTPLFKEPIRLPIKVAEGGHGGGDALLQEQIFSRKPPKEKLQRNAGHEQGIASAIIGIAANTSILSGKPVKIPDLVDLPRAAKRLSELV